MMNKDIFKFNYTRNPAITVEEKGKREAPKKWQVILVAGLIIASFIIYACFNWKREEPWSEVVYRNPRRQSRSNLSFSTRSKPTSFDSEVPSNDHEAEDTNIEGDSHLTETEMSEPVQSASILFDRIHTDDYDAIMANSPTNDLEEEEDYALIPRDQASH